MGHSHSATHSRPALVTCGKGVEGPDHGSGDQEAEAASPSRPLPTFRHVATTQATCRTRSWCRWWRKKRKRWRRPRGNTIASKPVRTCLRAAMRERNPDTSFASFTARSSLRGVSWQNETRDADDRVRFVHCKPDCTDKCQVTETPSGQNIGVSVSEEEDGDDDTALQPNFLNEPSHSPQETFSFPSQQAVDSALDPASRVPHRRGWTCTCRWSLAQ